MRELGVLSVSEGEADDERLPAEGEADPEPLDGDDEADERPPAAELIAQAEAALQAAQQLVQQLDAEQQTVAELIDARREAVLQAVGRQLAALDARKRGLLPVVVGELGDGPGTSTDEVCLAIDEAMQVAPRDFRAARLAETQTRRALSAARHAVRQAQQALVQDAIEAIEQEIASVLQTAGVA